MAFFDDFTSALKQKWLQYYQVNHSWLNLQMELEAVDTPDGGRRPPSYLILGILNALEPKLAQLMLPFARLNPSADALIQVLELDFDPDIALGNRQPGQAPPAVSSLKQEPAAPVSAPDIDDDDLGGFDEDAISEPVAVVASSTVVTSSTTVVEVELDDDALEDFGGALIEESSDEEEEVVGLIDDVALDDFGDTASDFGDTADDFGVTAEESSEEEADDFGGIGLDEFGDTSSEALSEESEDDFGGLGIEDSWGEGITEESSDDDSIADLGDLTLDSDDDLGSFGDINFDPFTDSPEKKEEEEDEWK